MVNRPIDLENSILSKSVNLLNVDFQVVNSKETQKVIIWDLVDSYSSLPKLLRITAYVIRFIDKVLTKSKINLKQTSNIFNNHWFIVKYYIGFCKLVLVHELARARILWTHLVQQSYFSKENLE